MIGWNQVRDVIDPLSVAGKSIRCDRITLEISFPNRTILRQRAMELLDDGWCLQMPNTEVSQNLDTFLAERGNFTIMGRVHLEITGMVR